MLGALLTAIGVGLWPKAVAGSGADAPAAKGRPEEAAEASTSSSSSSSSSSSASAAAEAAAAAPPPAPAADSPRPRNSLEEERMDALRQPLVDAARAGRLDAVRALLPPEDDASAGASSLRSPRRALQTIPFFGALTRGANSRRGVRDTAPIALYSAAAGGHLDVVKYLVREAGVDPDCYSGGPLSHAVHNGHLEIVRFLVTEGGANINRRTTQRHATALMYAAGEGRVDVVRWMLFNGADATFADAFGDTAADYAERAEHPACARLCRLRERGTPLRWSRAMHPAHPPEARRLAETLLMCANRGAVPPAGAVSLAYAPCPLAALPRDDCDRLVAAAVEAHLWGPAPKV